jgi:hypothetical protein
MRNSPCATIIDGIVAFDEKRLIRALSILKIPSMVWIRLHSVSLAFTVRIDQCSGNQVRFRNRMSVRKGEWVSEDGFDGTPNLQ